MESAAGWPRRWRQSGVRAGGERRGAAEALDRSRTRFEQAGGTRPACCRRISSKRGEAAELGGARNEALGRVDILVNNAGVGIGGAQAVVGDDDMARELFETNYWSALALIAALVPGMRDAGVGAVVNVASIGAVGADAARRTLLRRRRRRCRWRRRRCAWSCAAPASTCSTCCPAPSRPA